ncbi:MAG: Na+:H+ antiporter, NhaA family [Bacteroidales bacterium]|nr:Na+:H+ antiporter, NhaA family [Bacteroidales bacterium]MDN5330068.1 Na+:H+ antiporter, NhaA family [Bacteroidales bacterium]
MKKLLSPKNIIRLARPFQEFIQFEASSGILLIIAALVAILLANSSFSDEFLGLWQNSFSISLESWSLSKPIHLWINDGLMAIFFFMVGLEIKREIISGELASFKAAITPVIAAIGGMLVPALIYAAFNYHQPTSSGWGIPMATDIAFALGILLLLGKRIPLGLKIFITAFAIVDDLGAILVIALFYSHDLYLPAIKAAGIILLILMFFNYLNLRHPLFYVLPGIFLWYAFLKSGIHATIAGVLLAFTVPAVNNIGPGLFLKRMNYYLKRFKDIDPDSNPKLTQEQIEALQAMEISCHRLESPLQRMEHAIHPWVSFIIVPLFALSNAGVTFKAGAGDIFSSPIGWGIILGLIVGKFTGVFGFTWVAIKLGWARLPENVSFRHLAGAGFLGGIGFTMSLFITYLAFEDPLFIANAKTAIIIASAISALLGIIILLSTPRLNEPEPKEE